MKNLPSGLCALIAMVGLSLANAQAQTASVTPHSKGAATAPPTVGSGTAGQIPKWLGTDGSSFTIGDSIITETKFGLVGIGTAAPTSKLTVQGMIETKFGGLKFPDGTVQTTAGGAAAFFHDATLIGNGSSAIPLKVSVPLSLAGSSSLPIVTAINTFPAGNGLSAKGGSAGDFGGPGGDAVIAVGGNYNGLSSAPGGRGLMAIGGNSTDGDASGSRGGEGVFGQGGNSFASEGGSGVSGMGGSGGSHRGGDGVVGRGGPGTFSGAGAGVLGVGGTANLAGAGVLAFGGNSEDTGGDGILAQGGFGPSPGLAGNFFGNVQVHGTLSKSAGSFMIDHPLDPENKYLYHSFVESPDMMNIYNGNTTTDGNGDAVITLPDWFESLNKDFRYQLTVIGTFAQAIVGSEIKDNHFTIKTNAANVKVSWQVTGVRQDVFAKAHRIAVEEDKPEKERGYYLHPELFNQPEERGIEWARQPRLMKEMRDQRELTKEDSRKRNQPNQ